MPSRGSHGCWPLPCGRYLPYPLTENKYGSKERKMLFACTCRQHTIAFYAKYAISFGALLLAQFFVLIWTPTVGRFDALPVHLTELIFLKYSNCLLCRVGWTSKHSKLPQSGWSITKETRETVKIFPKHSLFLRTRSSPH